MPTIKHAIGIAASPERIYPLVSTGAGFAQWWAADVAEDASTKIVELGFFNRATIYRVKLVRAVAPQEAEWLCESGKEWQGTKLRFELTPTKDGTQLRFSHADWQAETDYFTSCNTTWGGLMFRLQAAAEGKAPGPLFSQSGIGY